jgi:hypothetical protein
LQTAFEQQQQQQQDGTGSSKLYYSSKQNMPVSELTFQQAHLTVRMSVLDPRSWQRLDIIL